jgi:N-acetylglucosamine-6-sulfatase
LLATHSDGDHAQRRNNEFQMITLARSTRLSVVLVALICGLCGPLGAVSPQKKGRAARDTRPNLIVIVVDDLRWDEFGAGGHPYLETPNIDRLATEGARFSNAIHVNPLCSPSRASILTGQYPSRHGIVDNTARDVQSHRLKTFPQALQRAGYETAHIGKWHMGNDPTPRPGYDHWVSFPGHGNIVNPALYENDQLHRVNGYITDILTERAVNFIRRERDTPFFLYIGHKAVHPEIRQFDDGSIETTIDASPAARLLPAPRHAGRYTEKVFPRRANVLDRPNDKPRTPMLAEILDRKSRSRLGVARRDDRTSEATIRRRAEMVLAVDEGLGRILNLLEDRGESNDTLILFTSDNGYFFGEHGLSIERRLPYEEAIRAPLLLRYPPLTTPGTTNPALIATIDIAPTLLELAGAIVGSQIQGHSFVPLLDGRSNRIRDAVLIEWYSADSGMDWLSDMPYRAIRTDRYKFIHWIQHPAQAELYDLESDPMEMSNLWNEPSYQSLGRQLMRELGELTLQAMGL